MESVETRPRSSPGLRVVAATGIDEGLVRDPLATLGPTAAIVDETS